MPLWLQTSSDQFLDLIRRAGPKTPEFEVEVLLLRLGLAFVLGVLVALICRVTTGEVTRSVTGAFLTTLVLLSVLLALVMLVVNDDVARAFSLAGALSIVRFRTVVEDTRDTAFVILAVVIGMAAGTGYWKAPLLALPIVLLGSVIFRVRGQTKQAKEEVREGSLVLRLGAAKPPDQAINEILTKRVGSYRLTSLATARGGAALDVTYAVPLPTADAALGLLAELSRVEGVQSVELKER